MPNTVGYIKVPGSLKAVTAWGICGELVCRGSRDISSSMSYVGGEWHSSSDYDILLGTVKRGGRKVWSLDV